MAETTGGELLEVLRIVRGLQETVQGLGSRMDGLTGRMDGLTIRMDAMASRMDGQSAQLSALTSRMDVLTSRMDVLTSRMDEQSARLIALATLVEEKAKLLEGLGGKFMHLHSVLDARLKRTEEHCEDVDKRVRVLEAR